MEDEMDQLMEFKRRTEAHMQSNLTEHANTRHSLETINETLNALAAADGVLVPLQAEYYAMEGLGALLRLRHGTRLHRELTAAARPARGAAPPGASTLAATLASPPISQLRRSRT